MSKKKKVIAIVAILLAIVVSFIGGNTYAKYTSKVLGYGYARIADWKFNVNGATDFFPQTIYLTTTADAKTLTEGKIAPGTKGSFSITVDATGTDVGVRYELITESEGIKPTNLKFKYNGITYNTITELLSNAGGTIYADDTNKIRKINIDWEWPYVSGNNDKEIIENDKIDTQSGLEGDYQFEVYVIGTQIDPNAEV